MTAWVRRVALGRVGAALSRGRESVVRREVSRACRVLSRDQLAEAIFQSLLFCGYPTAINGLRVLRVLEGAPPKAAPRLPDREVAHRGLALCRKVYGRTTPSLLRHLEDLHPLLPRWVICEGYGRMLSRGGLTVLERESAAAGCLIGQKAWRQAAAHLKAIGRMGGGTRVLVRWLAALAPVAGRAAVRSAIRLAAPSGPFR